MPPPDAQPRILRPFLLPAKRPWRTLLVAAVLLVAAALLCLRIEPTPSLAPMFSPDDPAARALVTVFDDFSAADNLLVLVRVSDDAPSDDAVARLTGFADRLARAIESDTDTAAMVSAYAYRAEDEGRRFIRELVAPNGLYYLSDAQLERLRERLSAEGIRQQVRRNEAMIAAGSPAADAMAEQVLQDPLRLHEALIEAMGPMRERFAMGDMEAGDGAFVGRDGRSLLIRIRAAKPVGDLDFTRSFMAAMREAVDRAEPGDLDVQYAGGYPTAETSERVIRGDMIRSVVGSLILLQIIFIVVYRKAWNFPLTFLPVAWGIQVAFGVYAIYSPRLTPVVAASGAILAGLGIDYAIHYLSHYHAHRASGDGPIKAIGDNRKLIPTLTAACVTSLIGFGAIAATGVPALQDFAVIGALGLAGALIGTLVVLPATLALVDRHDEHQAAPLRFDLQPMVRAIAHRRHAWLIGSSAVMVGVLVTAAIAWPIRFESDMTTMQPSSSAPLAAQQDIATQFPGALETAQVLIEADTPQQLLRTAHEVDRRLMSPALKSRGVAAPLSIAMLLPDPADTAERRAAIDRFDTQRIIDDFDAALNISAFDPAAYAGYRDFLRTFFSPGPPPGVAALSDYPQLAETMLPRTAFADPPTPPTAALAMVQFTRDFNEPGERHAVNDAIADVLADLDGVTVTGMDIVAREIREAVQADLPLLLAIAAVCVAGWLWVVFRSVRRVVLILIPPTCCMAALLAVMHALGVQLNMVNLIAIPMLVGIGVDDGVFLVSIAARHRGRIEPMVAGMAASCHAILLTSATTTLAFGSLLFTQTPAIQSLGLVLAVGVIVCWLASNLLLLPLLIVLEARRTPSAAPEAGGEA